MSLFLLNSYKKFSGIVSGFKEANSGLCPNFISHKNPVSLFRKMEKSQPFGQTKREISKNMKKTPKKHK